MVLYRDLLNGNHLNVVGCVSALSELIRLSNNFYLFADFVKSIRVFSFASLYW